MATVLVDGLIVKSEPRVNSENIAEYNKGDRILTVDLLIFNDDRLWLRYTGKSGNKRYVYMFIYALIKMFLFIGNIMKMMMKRKLKMMMKRKTKMTMKRKIKMTMKRKLKMTMKKIMGQELKVFLSRKIFHILI